MGEFNKPSIRKALNEMTKQDDEVIEDYNNIYNEILNGHYTMKYDEATSFIIAEEGLDKNHYTFYRNDELITTGSILWMIRTLYWFMDSITLIENDKNELQRILVYETGLDELVIESMTWDSLIDLTISVGL